MAEDKVEAQLQVRFVTKQEQLVSKQFDVPAWCYIGTVLCYYSIIFCRYAVPDSPYAIQSNYQPSDLNKVVNALLKETNSWLEKAVQFDFLVCGELLSSTLAEHLQEKGVSTEDTLEIEYLERFPAPTPQDCLMHDDWVSAVQGHDNWSVYFSSIV